MVSTRSQRGVLLDGPPPPRLLVAPSVRSNSWEEVADLAASLGAPLDEWQEFVLESAMGERADGRWASKFVGISAPRQNGKSQIIVARALAGILLFGEKTIIVSAHQTDTAREVFQRLLDVIEGNPALERRVSAVMKAVNRESITFGKGKDAQTIKIKARVAAGARGFSSDCLLLDEAQILGKRAWGSIVPTMSARPNPQLWLFGTPPTLEDDAFAFARVRESARAKKPRHTWLEWAAGPADDLDDPATWAAANPSFGVRISAEACADDRAAMDDEQFQLERLGMWAESTASGAFGLGAWKACEGSPLTGMPMTGLGVAVSIDFSRAAIVGAGRAAEMVAVKPLHVAPDPYGWLVARVVDLSRRHDVPVVIDGRGPAAVFIPAIKAAIGDACVVAGTADVLDACAGIYQLVQAGGLTHGGYPELSEAVANAQKRDVQDRWAWGRRKSGGDISPLEAATLAVWKSTDARPLARSAYETRGVLTV